MINGATDASLAKISELGARLESEIVAAVTASEVATSTARQASIDTVLEKLAENGATDAAGAQVVEQLGKTTAALGAAVDAIAPKMNSISANVAKLMACSLEGKVLGADGKCVSMFVKCAAKPTVRSNELNIKATISYAGEPVVGTVAEFKWCVAALSL